jgi:hypothetical protein
MLRNCHWLLIAIVAWGLSAEFAAAQKPRKNSPPPPPPPVYYQVQFYTVNTPGALKLYNTDTNNVGQTVGAFSIDLNGDGVADGNRAYLYDPAVNLDCAVNLNDIVLGIPAGSIIRSAQAINETGLIAAFLVPTDGSDLRRQAVVIDLNQNTPMLYSIPDSHLTVHSTPGDVNVWGDVVVRYKLANGSFGNYRCNFNVITKTFSVPEDLKVTTSGFQLPRINNAGDIVGALGNAGIGLQYHEDAYRIKRGTSTIEMLADRTPLALNEAGAFTGYATVTSDKNRYITSAFVQDTSLRLFEDTFYNQGRDLNEDGDVLRTHHLYHSGHNKTFVLKDLLDPRDPGTAIFQDYSEISCNSMTERDELTKFPVLTGIYTKTGWGFQLFPVQVPE